MIRGTTPTVVLRFPFKVSEVSECTIYFTQGKETILKKDTDECIFCGKSIFVRMTQDETYRFAIKKRLGITARYKIKGGKVTGVPVRYLHVTTTGLPEEDI